MAAREEFRPLRIALFTYSSRYTLDENPRAEELNRALAAAGHAVVEQRVGFGDATQMQAVVRELLDSPAQALISVGGTGVLDPMPEAVRGLLDREVPGFAQMFQALSLDDVGSSGMLSRALAGIAGGRLVFLIPGSRDGCRLAFQRLVLPQLDCTTKPCALAGLLPLPASIV